MRLYFGYSLLVVSYFSGVSWSSFFVGFEVFELLGVGCEVLSTEYICYEIVFVFEYCIGFGDFFEKNIVIEIEVETL